MTGTALRAAHQWSADHPLKSTRLRELGSVEALISKRAIAYLPCKMAAIRGVVPNSSAEQRSCGVFVLSIEPSIRLMVDLLPLAPI